MVKKLQGRTPASAKIAVIDTDWNDFIVSRLTEGALATLSKHGATVDHVTVPGAYELPLAVKTAAETGRYDGVVALGCVIKGATPHFDYVAGEAAKGLSAVMQSTGIPVSFGVLTTDTIEQAIERAGTKLGNKGAEAASVVLDMIGTLAAIKSGEGTP